MLTIGTLSRKTGTKTQTIRYYEQIGLMEEPGRTAGRQRRYFEKDLARLAFIRHSRQLGFSVESIRELLDLSDNPARSCPDAGFIACRHLKQVEQRIKRLQALKKELKRMVAECEGDNVADCKVLEVLRDHSECATEHDEM
jgi:Cu(I)-responsive transcriptional regulator